MHMQAPPRTLKANPNLRTLHDVERILRAAAKQREPPLSYAELGSRMPATAVRYAGLEGSGLELARPAPGAGRARRDTGGALAD